MKIRQSVIAQVLSVATCVFLLAGCSKDDSAGGINPEYHAPTSYKLAADNLNFPYGGTISTGNADAPRGSEIISLADGSVATDYSTGMSEVEIIYASTDPFALNVLSLVSSAEAGSDPISMVLHGSADKSKWQQLYTEKSVLFTSRGQELTWTVSSTKKYSYYRLRLSSINGSIRLAEWKMTENEAVADEDDDEREVIDFSDLIPLATDNAFSDITPMGKRYENVKYATAEQLAWLNDPTQNPPIEAASLNPENYMMKALEVNLYPYGLPSPADVNQRAIGDCCACAVLASFAYNSPKFIQSIITRNGNVFTVKMYNPAGEPIIVKVNNEFICGLKGKLQALSGKNQVATWSTVLEKALMKYQYVYGYKYGIGGIGTLVAMAPFTGNGGNYSFSPGTLTPQQMERLVKGALSQGYFVIGGFKKGDVVIEEPYKSVTGHAFTFMYPNSENGLFAVRNPWGKAQGSPDGMEDGVMNIPNNREITDIVNFTIHPPAAAEPYFETMGPYFPPQF